MSQPTDQQEQTYLNQLANDEEPGRRESKDLLTKEGLSSIFNDAAVDELRSQLKEIPLLVTKEKVIVAYVKRRMKGESLAGLQFALGVFLGKIVSTPGNEKLNLAEYGCGVDWLKMRCINHKRYKPKKKSIELASENVPVFGQTSIRPARLEAQRRARLKNVTSRRNVPEETTSEQVRTESQEIVGCPQAVGNYPILTSGEHSYTQL